MTNGEYMRERLRAFDISEAQLLDSGIDLTAPYVAGSRPVALAMIRILEDLVLAPQRTNISEGGFSVSWDTTNLGRYYKYLCSKYGVEPNSVVTENMGIPTITDVSSNW